MSAALDQTRWPHPQLADLANEIAAGERAFNDADASYFMHKCAERRLAALRAVRDSIEAEARRLGVL